MTLKLKILYRGPLASCNYDCWYCPFAKVHDTAGQLAADRQALVRFVDWVARRESDQISVLLTPWGEGLTRPWYQEALARLTHLPQVPKAAIQTNLSWRLGWLDRCHLPSLGLWCSYHPGEVERADFLRQCQRLSELGISYSVGMVGLREEFAEIETMRAQLPQGVYLWINAYKDEPDYYQPEEIEWLERIDPLFRLNTVRHASLGQPCHAGESVISVDGEGTIRRCHFIAQPLGNIYQDGWENVLQPRLCSNATCGCHIGYVHLKPLNQYPIYPDGLLERVPGQLPQKLS